MEVLILKLQKCFKVVSVNVLQLYTEHTIYWSNISNHL